MPHYATIDGIRITVNSGEHNPPHVHTQYQGKKARYSLQGENMDEKTTPMPPKIDRKIREYVLDNVEGITQLWKELNPTLRD